MKFVVYFDYTEVDDDAKEFWDRSENDPDFDEDAWIDAHTCVKEIELNCTDEEIEEWAIANQDEISEIESEYGVLDAGGSDDAFEYSAYEISREDTDIVWGKLVSMLRVAGLVAE